MTKSTKWSLRPAKTQISLGIHPVWWVFVVRMKKAWVLSYPMSRRRPWSDWADAQADLSLRWAHSHFVGFVMRWLNYVPVDALSRTVWSHTRAYTFPDACYNIVLGVAIPMVRWVTGHIVPRSFRTQVISYPLLLSIWSFYTQFGHFILISYPVWSFRTFLLLLFSRKQFWSFRTYFLLFRTKVILYQKSFCTHFSHFVPRSFRTHFQTRYELSLVRSDFLFCCNLLLPD